MPSILVRNQIMPGRFNNYLLAGNVCNAFILGEVGSQDDFFLVGAEPTDESPYPLLTGNILDSEGTVLFRLVRNMLVFNPGDCSRIFGDRLGYEIHDSAGKPIFKVKTVFSELPPLGYESFVTTIAANFYNKKGELVFRANSGEEDERIELNVKSVIGFTGGGFGIVQDMNGQELDLARIVLATRGAVHQLLTGQFDGQEISLDGKAVHNARITNCQIRVTTGEFALYGQNEFSNSTFQFEGAAENIRQLVINLVRQHKEE